MKRLIMTYVAMAGISMLDACGTAHNSSASGLNDQETTTTSITVSDCTGECIMMTFHQQHTRGKQRVAECILSASSPNIAIYRDGDGSDKYTVFWSNGSYAKVFEGLDTILQTNELHSFGGTVHLNGKVTPFIVNIYSDGSTLSRIAMATDLRELATATESCRFYQDQ